MKTFFLMSVLAPMAPAQSVPDPTEVPLRVEIAIAQGEETHTYTLDVTANRSRLSELRQGREIAIQGESAPQYRNVGTNIQCKASTRGDRFLVWLALERSSIAESAGGHPSFHTFHVMSELLLASDEDVSLVTSSEDSWTVNVMLRVRD